MPVNDTMTLLPCAADKCQQCAITHPPEAPHNQTSLYWQYWFYGKHGRWPTWTDAMAHCDDATKEQWTVALLQLGQDIGEPGSKAGGTYDAAGETKK